MPRATARSIGPYLHYQPTLERRHLSRRLLEARRIAEKAANRYVQNNLDAIIRSNVEMFDNISSLEEDEGDDLASHVD